MNLFDAALLLVLVGIPFSLAAYAGHRTEKAEKRVCSRDGTAAMKLRTVVTIALATLFVPIALLLFIAWAVGKS